MALCDRAIEAFEFLYLGQKQGLLALSMSGLRNEFAIENDVSGAESHRIVAPEQRVIFIHGKLVSFVQLFFDSQRTDSRLTFAGRDAAEELGAAAGPI